MSNKILILGASGFIGSEILKKIITIKGFEIYRYSTRLDKPIDYFDVKNTKFKTLIFASGVHGDIKKSKNLFIENKKILKIFARFIHNATNCIFISSFKTSISSKKNIIEENNKYDFFKEDSDYGKIKFISEKIALKFFEKNKINYKIISPSHVIGPTKLNNNPNNIDIINRSKNLINIVPDCYLSLIDVRDVASTIVNILKKDKFDNKKIILNTKNILFKDYIKLLKKSKPCINIVINNKFLIIFSNILNFVSLILNKKFNILTKFQMNYILTKKITVIRENITHEYKLDKTFSDILEKN
jgi:nucleoside-diphosphate-sugar epimerase